MRFALLASFAAWIAGCASDPILEIGTGTTAFEAIEDGQDIPMIEGLQGGWHVWLSVRLRGFDSSNVHVELVTTPVQLGRPRQATFLDQNEIPQHNGWHELVGVAAVFSAPECFQDHDVAISATIIDAAGVSATDERIVVPRWPTAIGFCEYDREEE